MSGASVGSGQTVSNNIVSSFPAFEVNSGGTDIGAVVDGGEILVNPGGSGSAITVNAGGTVDVYGVTQGTILDSGGRDYAAAGGVAIGSVVNAGGTADVASGGIDSGSTLNSAGFMLVSSGGIASAVVVNSSGLLVVEYGGAAVGTVISPGGMELVLPGGVGTTVLPTSMVSAGAVQSGSTFGTGTEIAVQSGGTLIAATLSGYALAVISSGGVASGVSLVGDGTEIISSGGTAMGTRIASGTVLVAAGGLASDTVISGNFGYSATQIVDGTAIGTVVAFGGAEDVQAGGTASGTVVQSIASQIVAGRAVGTVVSAGGGAVVVSGGVFSGGALGSNSYFHVSAGGAAVGTLLNGGSAAVTGTTIGMIVGSGSVEDVASGGSASATVVSSGGLLLVGAGGAAVGTIVQPGGHELVLPGGSGTDVLATTEVTAGQTSSGLAASSGAEILVQAGGTLIGATIGYAGLVTVSSGGVARADSIGGYQTVLAGGSAVLTVVSGGVEIVDSGGVSSDSSIVDNGSVTILSGASASDIVDLGSELVSAGGVASGSQIAPGGQEVVSAGGSAVDAVVSGAGLVSYNIGFTGEPSSATQRVAGVALATSVTSGAVEIVLSGGSTTSTVAFGTGGYYSNGSFVTPGADIAVDNGGFTYATVLSSGGAQTVLSGGTASLTEIGSGGSETVQSGGSTDATLLNGGTLELQSGADAGSAISFERGAASLLQVDGGVMPSATIYGFSGSDAILLRDVAYSAADQLAVSGGGVALVTPSGSYDLGLSAAEAAGASVGADAAGTLLTACFAAGTRIRTPRGEMPVEQLRIGDDVLGLDGNAVPIVWLGHRSTDCRRHPRPHDVWPVRVRAGAFGPAQPGRDLLLSPDHAVFADGALVPIRYLLNGRTIAQERCDRIAYWHVELPRHGVVLAENLPVESYLDTGNRGAFDNGGGAVQLHPDFAFHVWRAEACAPLLRAGAALIALRQRLLDRAAALGDVRTHDPDLHLIAAGRRIAPEGFGSRRSFRLPAASRAVRLVSRSAIPAETRADGADGRRLGVALRRIVLDGSPIALDDPRLGAGWHDVEYQGMAPDFRWTDGDARLLLDGGRWLELVLAVIETYWADQIGAPAAAAGRQAVHRPLIKYRV